MNSINFMILKSVSIAVAVSCTITSPAYAQSNYKCPSEINDENIRPGSIFLRYTHGDIVTIRNGYGPNKIKVDAPLSEKMRVYYYAQPDANGDNMLFSLARLYDIKPNYTSNLKSDEILVSNSCIKIPKKKCRQKDFAEKTKARSTFERLHNNKNHETTSLIAADYHLPFSNTNLKNNSYISINNTSIYNPENLNEFDGAKARIIRHRGVPAAGKCVYFELFDNETFAGSVETMSNRLIVLNNGKSTPKEFIDFVLTNSE